MPGFIIYNRDWDTVLKDYRNEKLVKGSMEFDGIHVKRNTLNKFTNDKVFFQNDSYAFVTEGLILNKSSLIKSYGVNNLDELLMTMAKNNELFFSKFRGSFSGFWYDKTKKCGYAWTNQTGESPLFYYNENGIIIVASSPEYILYLARSYHLNLSLNEQAVYSMLTYAYMYDGLTYANEIHRLLPGQYIYFDTDGMRVEQYYDLPWGKYDLSGCTEEQILEELNNRFRNAVKLEYEKDVEYGYRHLVDISGGLDSRMAAWVAKDLGFKELQCIHYSQSCSNEEIITKEIVNALDAELIYYPLDSHRFLYDAEKLIKMNYGLQLYSGITGGQRMLDSIDMSSYGIEHTGILGGAVIGSYLKEGTIYTARTCVGAYSNRLLDLVNMTHIDAFRENIEKQFLYIRGMNGILSSAFIRRNYTEIASPFMDLEVIEFCMSIPVEMRMNHKMYKKWIIKYYPEAANIRWSADDCKITDGKTLQLIRRAYYHGPKKIARKLGMHKYGEKVGMNPFEYWYHIDPECISQWENVIQTQSAKYNNSIRDAIDKVYKGGVLEKTQAITACLSLLYWFPNGC